MKRLITALAVAALFLPTIESAAARAATLKIATLAPEGSSWMNIMHEMMDEVTAETDGRIKFKIYPGGIQGDERDVIRKMRAGQLHGGGFTGNGLGVILPRVRVLEIPFLFNDYNEVRAVVDSLDSYFADYFDKEDYVLLGWANVGFVYLFSQEPITCKKDILDKKVWLWEGDPLAETFMAEFGIKPIPLAITDVLMSLSTQMINTVYTAPMACVGLQWFTKVKYMTDYPVTNSVGAVIVSRKSWDRIPEDLQPVVRRICDKHFARLAETTIEDNAKSIETLKKNGIKLVEVGDEGRADFNKVSLTTREKLAGSLYPADLQERVEKLLADYRAGQEGE